MKKKFSHLSCQLYQHFNLSFDQIINLYLKKGILYFNLWLEINENKIKESCCIRLNKNSYKILRFRILNIVIRSNFLISSVLFSIQTLFLASPKS